MKTDETTARLIAVIADIGDLPTEEVTPEKYFVDDLDIDSLSMVEIGATIEDEFGVAIPDDKLADLKTVGDLATFVTERIAAS
ncbi:acyl carrier protein [Saccharomonospora sp. NB11]|jgi:acyl carrier protein|uniref:acyl carrier protein n=1 Tax=Saccharomonospora sp. NB11 TaxID=1642298 RepID=UPI0018D1E3A0|nr:acyl carrier protein [Saccharomonospora sp. NB11]